VPAPRRCRAPRIVLPRLPELGASDATEVDPIEQHAQLHGVQIDASRTRLKLAYSAENDRVDRVDDREDQRGDQTRAENS
jgi:hypothetical protein